MSLRKELSDVTNRNLAVLFNAAASYMIGQSELAQENGTGPVNLGLTQETSEEIEGIENEAGLLAFLGDIAVDIQYNSETWAPGMKEEAVQGIALGFNIVRRALATRIYMEEGPLEQ